MKIQISILALAITTFFSSTVLGGQKPWSPRKDCSGIYGKKTNEKSTEVALGTLLKETKKYQGKLIRVKGKVTAACRKKGCWMMLSDGSQKMRVRFKGYGFFVPTNSAGYNATVVGFAKARTISVKMLRHYAMDAGKPEQAKKITKPKHIVSFMASWVVMSKATTQKMPKATTKKATK